MELMDDQAPARIEISASCPHHLLELIKMMADISRFAAGPGLTGLMAYMEQKYPGMAPDPEAMKTNLGRMVRLLEGASVDFF
jgi:hypothetical protein